MPIISRFFGIVIFMHWREHPPPHFHAKYGDEEIAVEIDSGNVTGKMARRALAMVEEWRQTHQDELRADWERLEQRRALNHIPPLE